MRRWLLLFCFNITQKELARWYKQNESYLNHAEWKDNYQAVTYLKRFVKYQIKGKKKRVH